MLDGCLRLLCYRSVPLEGARQQQHKRLIRIHSGLFFNFFCIFISLIFFLHPSLSFLFVLFFLLVFFLFLLFLFSFILPTISPFHSLSPFSHFSINFSFPLSSLLLFFPSFAYTSSIFHSFHFLSHYLSSSL